MTTYAGYNIPSGPSHGGFTVHSMTNTPVSIGSTTGRVDTLGLIRDSYGRQVGKIGLYGEVLDNFGRKISK